MYDHETQPFLDSSRSYHLLFPIANIDGRTIHCNEIHIVCYSLFVKLFITRIVELYLNLTLQRYTIVSVMQPNYDVPTDSTQRY
jgi:uncharacterized protein involved in response to NO